MSRTLACCALAITGLLASHATAAAEPDDAPAAALASFGEEAGLDAFIQRVGDARRKREEFEAAEAAKRKAEWEAYRKAHPPVPTGSVFGTTKPGSNVVVENVATGHRREATADVIGNYRFYGLPFGTYTVTADGKTRRTKIPSRLQGAQVTVYGGAVDAIDVASVASTTILTHEQLDTASANPDVTSVALLAPGTVGPGNAITNVQTLGVDEGGIVKKAGDFLVVLRRGRLFSVRANDAELRTVSSTNAYGTGIDPRSTWYDEMLISGRTIVVIGFSYERGGSEIGLFDLAADGRLSYRATYQLLSHDYYSSRNYASRLVGDTLVFYSPIDLFTSDAPHARLPGARRWTGKDAPFQRIAAADHVYRSGIAEDSLDQTLHTVTRCRIGDGTLDCQGTSVVGPAGSAFYVSRNAVYVWMVQYKDDDRTAVKRTRDEASVVRMPLDGSAPSAMRVEGAPIDQMSFLERNGYLNVLVGAEREGLRMWAAEGNSGGLALLRVRIHDFGDAGAASRPEDYRALPSGQDGDGFWELHNRYVGDWLIYGGEEATKPAFALRFAGRQAPVRLALGHAVERVEAMGRDALLVGPSKDDLVLTSVSLGESAAIASRSVLPGMRQGDQRSHGFFYQPQAERQGLFGLPVIQGKPGTQTAAMQFLRNANLRLDGVGSLVASAAGGQGDADDGCVASCIDWYGGARPIFVGDRIYGLLGYELIEGAMVDGGIRERRRVNFMPRVARRK